jgi:hypothetical protein
MALLSLKKRSSVEPVRRIDLRACTFERSLLSGGLVEGGVLTCRCPDGREWSLTVGMTWDVLGVLRGELARAGTYEADETILRDVLRCWGIEEFTRRLCEGIDLPSEGLVLRDLGGPVSSRPRRLLQASGLLPPHAA